MLNTKKCSKLSIRIPIIILVDILLLSFAFFITNTFMTDQISAEMTDSLDVLWALGIYIFLTIGIMSVFGSFKKAFLDKTSDTVVSVVLAVIASHVICEVVFTYFGNSFNFGMVVAGSLSTVFLLVCHTLQKFIREFYLKSFENNSATGIPTLIIGAGFTGKMVYRELTEFKDVDVELRPVCFIDDDKEKISTEICGLHVYGPTMLIPEVCKKHNIGMVVFAIPSCPAERRKSILASCQKLDCQVRIIPSLDELHGEKYFFKQAVDVEKLLGRDAVNIQSGPVADYLKDKTCLVTGGGGSIGSELCRQIIKMNPKKLVIVDIYENNAYDIQQELLRMGYSSDKVCVEIGSVRDMAKMRVIFEEYGFDVIFHAAAHKHVPLMETNPEEAIKNNVKGTYNIAHLAHRYNAQKMVLISTDKAVNPTNVMGATKRVCEMVMQYMSQTYSHTKFTSVRFGNVLGSNGSVIPLFTKQIESGGPVTVTHPDIIRYFMTIPEAVSLVLEAGTVSDGGEIFVLDMGEPVKIVTLAENLIKMYGYEPYKDMQIEFCGLRRGEKLYEELLTKDENLKETHSKKIFIMEQRHINCQAFRENMQRLMDTAGKNDSEKAVEMLRNIVPEFKTPDEVNNA